MAGFVYYIPGAASGSALPIALTKQLEGSLTKRQVTRGPKPEPGIVIGIDGRVPPEKIGYYEDEQTWRQAPGGEWWVGYLTADRPKPDDLVRKSPLAGQYVTLCDGGQWLCPIARLLPHAVGIDENGKWGNGEVLPEYAALLGSAQQWLDTLSAQQDSDVVPEDTPQFDEMVNGAFSALQANYMLGPTEVTMLGLFSEQSIVAILNVLIDLEGLRKLADELVKKKQADAEESCTAVGS